MIKRPLYCFVLCLVVLLSGSLISICQKPIESKTHGDWKVLSEGPISDMIGLHKVVFWDSLNGLGTDVLRIKSTNDGGKTWKDVEKVVDHASYDMVSGQNGSVWIAGSNKKDRPAILHSGDFGKSWAEIPLIGLLDDTRHQGFKRFFAVCLSDDGTLWAGGDTGILNLIPGKSGLQIASFHKTDVPVFDIACSGGEVWAVGRSGLILRKRKEWEQVEGYGSYRFLRVVKNSMGVWILGSEMSDKPNPPDGILLFQGPNSDELKNATPKAAKSLNDIAFLGNEGWLVGNKGSIYFSKDKGMNWIPKNSPTKNRLFSIFILDEKNRWIVGDVETVLRWNK